MSDLLCMPGIFFQILDIDLDDSVQSGTADQPIPQNVNDPPEVR